MVTSMERQWRSQTGRVAFSADAAHLAWSCGGFLVYVAPWRRLTDQAPEQPNKLVTVLYS